MTDIPRDDDLRTRIAAAIYKDNDFGWSKYMCEEAADAVIAELGLEEQSHYDPECHFYRYVTDWIDPSTKFKVDLP